MKESLVFLDTCVFFNCILDERKQNILNHARNLDISLMTSITVMGETIDQMREFPDREEVVRTLLNLFDYWEIISLYPNAAIAELCYKLSYEDTDYRVEKTDLVHLGYALAYGCNFFITSDKNLIKYRIPKSFQSAGFQKPIMLSLEEFKDQIR